MDSPAVPAESREPANPPGDDRGHRVELYATILLGLATVAIAVATFRGTFYDDRVAENFHDALVEAGRSNDQFGLYDTTFAFEQGLFIEWLVATTEGNDDAAALIEGVMGPGLTDTVTEWFNGAGGDADSPFDYDTSRLESTEFLTAAEDFADGAADFEAAAKDADRKGDLVGLAQVLFAVTLFSAGMAAILRTAAMQRVVLMIGMLVLVVGGAILVAGETA
jgi:hypothetical protein